MQIAIITSGFLPVPATKGGAVENLIVNILKENEKNKKINFKIFSIYEEKALQDSKKYKYSNFEFLTVSRLIKLLDKTVFFIAKNILKKENSQSYRYIFQRLSYLNRISKKLKKEYFDKILLENHPSQYLALKWRKNYMKYDGKYYYHCHNTFPGTYGCKNIINKTKGIICVSEFIASSISKYTSIEKDKFLVLRNCIDTMKFRTKLTKEENLMIKNKYSIKKNEKILLFTGRIIPEKGVMELIESLKYVKSKNYKLLILGSALNEFSDKTEYEEKIQKMVEQYSDKIIFTGFIKYDDIFKYYSIADIAVLPSIWDDPAPLTIIESLTCGVPIITTNSGGIPEYAQNGSAIIIDRDENLPKKLAESIDYLIKNDNIRSEMSMAGIEASKELNLDNYYYNFCNLLI